jgi:urease accessory protein
VNAGHLLHLLQLASPALPVGAYSYSQALEAAMEAGLVNDAASAHQWIARHLHEVQARWDGPIFLRLLRAFACRDHDGVAMWSERYLASRDTSEFRAETVQMGYSLTRLLAELGVADVTPLGSEVGFPAAFACAVDAHGIAHEDALVAMLFAWVENQVLVCVKSVPLGQVAGQRMLLALHDDVMKAARTALATSDDDMASWSPGLSLLSMRHEVQHGRLYRS